MFTMDRKKARRESSYPGSFQPVKRSPAAAAKAGRPSNSRQASLPATHPVAQRLAVLEERANRRTAVAQLRDRQAMTEGNRAPVVQRVMTFDNSFGQNIDRNDVQTVLQQMPNQQLVALRNAANVDVQLGFDDVQDVNPGDTTIEVDDGNGWQNLATVQPNTQYQGVRVVVNVRSWFANSYDVGTVVSMFMHELGAHVLPYTQDLIQLTQVGGVGQNARDALLQDDQYQEHLNAANMANQSFTDYQQLVQDASGQLNAMGLTDDATRLANAYLMDISTFDDTGRRVRFPSAPGGIAENRNMLRMYMPWMNNLDVEDQIGASGVMSYYGGYYLAGLPAGIRMMGAQHPWLATGALGLLGAGLLYWGGGKTGINDQISNWWKGGGQ